MTPKVRYAIKKRNRLRKQVSTKRKEWLDACQEVREVTEESKRNRWIDYLDTIQSEQDSAKTWRVIKSLDGTPDSMAPGEALKHNGKDIVTDAKKAEVFGKYYASVSRLKFTARERLRNRLAKKRTNAQGPDDKSCAPITMEELEFAISLIRASGAPGPDDIAPSFLKNLGPKAMTELLRIFNESFSKGFLPPDLETCDYYHLSESW